MPHTDGRERAASLRPRRLRGGVDSQETGDAADAAIARRRRRGEIDRLAPGQTARRLRPLDAPTAGGSNGGVGGCGIDQPGDGPSDAEKNGMTKRKIEYWVIPPDADGEFVANMEEVLETYEKAYDPANPVVCMDEQPVQLIGETRVPIPPTKEHPERVDYEYERKGTASIFPAASSRGKSFNPQPALRPAAPICGSPVWSTWSAFQSTAGPQTG